MVARKILLVYINILISCVLFAQKIPVIVDTDGAPDDLRAIVLLIAGNKYDIKLFVCTEGALPVDSIAGRLNQLENQLNVNIPIATGKRINLPEPVFRKNALQIQWGSQNKQFTYVPFDSVKGLSECKIYIALGPLTNAAGFLKSPLLNSAERLIWYNTSITNGFNFKADTMAFYSISELKNITLEVISNQNMQQAVINDTLLAKILSVGNIYAAYLAEVFKPFFEKKGQTMHLTMWDDLVAVYLHYPQIFKMKQQPFSPRIITTADYDLTAVNAVYTDLLAGKVPGNEDIVFNIFPTNKTDYQYDVREIKDRLIARYGYVEWKAAVLTHEFHQHLGIYSIAGVKMGILAREYFNAGIDQLTVVSNAGTIPPLSCMNDGLQCSTGATIGRGTITLSDSLYEPSAIFEYRGNRIKITLKPQYVKQAENDIAQGIVQFGNLSNGYWQFIRQLSIRYWDEWDRNTIFEVTKLSPENNTKK